MALASATIAFGLASPKAMDGQFYQNGTTPQQGIDFASQFAGIALSFRINVPGVGTGQRNTSATFLNSGFAITAAHNITDLLQFNPTFEVADGNNYLTNRGNVMSISNIIFHPTLDLAILQFTAPFFIGNDRQIGTVSTDDRILFAGFGAYGTPATGVLPRDGYLRAGDGHVADFVVPDDSEHYRSFTFGTGNLQGLQLNALGTSGTSGGPVIRLQLGADNFGNSPLTSQLVGIMTSATTPPGEPGASDFLYLGETSTAAWIRANTIVPEPSIVALILSGGAAAWLAARRRR